MLKRGRNLFDGRVTPNTSELNKQSSRFSYVIWGVCCAPASSVSSETEKAKRMITKDNLPKVLDFLGFDKQGNVYSKHYNEANCDISIDFKKERIDYPSSIDTGANLQVYQSNCPTLPCRKDLVQIRRHLLLVRA